MIFLTLYESLTEFTSSDKNYEYFEKFGNPPQQVFTE